MVDWNKFRRALEKYYESILGPDYAEFIDFRVIEDFDRPAWYDLNAAPLKLSSGAEIKGPGGLLLDPEIGLSCFFLEFKDEDTTRAQISRAISFRSKLLPGPVIKAKTDETIKPTPEWRACIHWIVKDDKSLSEWKEVISKMRNFTAHLEEVAVDVVLLENNNPQKAIVNHRLPRLLLYLRKVLRLSGRDQIYRWRSADDLVKRMLLTFAENVPEELRHYSEELVKYGQKLATEFWPTHANEADRKPKELGSLVVENFRNVTERITLDLGPQIIPTPDGSEYVTAIAHVIHGPNATGKTTLYEALQFALVGSSERMSKFREDPDTARKRPEAYLGYLRPFENPNAVPKAGIVGMDKKQGAMVEIKCDKDPRENIVASELKGLKDAMFSQQRIREFAHFDSATFSAEVMRDYSPLSTALRDYLAIRLSKASDKRKGLLRELGLQPTYTILVNAKDAYVNRLWSSKLPSISEDLLDSLEYFGPRGNISEIVGFEDMNSALKSVIVAWKTQPDHDTAMDSNVWMRYLENYNRAVIKLKRWYEPLRKMARNWDESKKLDNLDLWAKWIRETKQKVPSDKRREENLRKKLQKLNAERDGLRKKGELLKERLEHFDSMSHFLYNRWLPENPDVCPTCDTKFESAKGGLKAFINSLIQKLTKEREDLRERYKKLVEEIEEIDYELSKLGAPRFPLADYIRSDVAKMIETLCPRAKNVEEVLLDDAMLAVVRNRAEILIKGLNIPAENPEAESLARELASQVKKEVRRMDEIWKAPELWKNLSAIVDKHLAQIVRKHLPDTIGTVWWEIAMCMTSASWLPTYTELKIKVENERKSQLVVKDKKALYVLNSAEVNIAGLAWFITRYLLEGRWRYRFMVIDDPAQGMDEVIYREFCRFIYTLLFLHKAAGLPWSLVLFQHEEDRATISAKALYGIIHRLGWDSKSAPKLLRTMEIAQGIWEIPPVKKAFA